MNNAKKSVLLSYLIIAASAIYINSVAAATIYDSPNNSTTKLLAQDSADRDLDYERAILLIHKEEYTLAAHILENYILTGRATMRMQGDYLEALFKMGRYKQVLSTAQQLWANDYSNISVRALMFIADSLFQLHDYGQAAPKYQLLLTKDPDNLYANLSFAYCLAMLKQDKQALARYEHIYTLAPIPEDTLLQEAAALLAHDKRQLANKLYKFLEDKSTYPNKVILAKSTALSRNGYYIASNQALSKLADDPNLQREYFAQLFTNSMDNELYHTAARTLPKIKNTSTANIYRKLHQHARKGGLSVSFSTMSNYKGNSIQTYRLENDDYLGMNTALTAAIDNSRFSDTVHTTSVTTTTLGLVHRFEYGKIHAALSNAVNGSSHTLYNAGFNYKLTDLTSVGFDVGRRYIGDSKAIINGFITENYYTLSMAHRLNPKNTFFVDYTTASLSDHNHAYGYSLSYSYYPVKDRAKSHELYSYYRRSGFSKLSPYYESPDKRISYGLGWQAQWNMRSGAYWVTRVNLELGHDNLEPTDFSPAVRVQYTHPISKHQEIALAAEYGLRTNKLNHINYFMHGYKQFDIKYNISW